MKVPFVDLKAQYLEIKPEVDAAIAGVIADTAFISGKYARSFETRFANYLGVEHCVGVANGTDAPTDVVLTCTNIPIGFAITVHSYSMPQCSLALQIAPLHVKDTR